MFEITRRTFIKDTASAPLALAAGLALVAEGPAAANPPPALAAFGYRTKTQNGVPALAGRPLLIIIGEYSNFPPFSSTHTSNYYELLGFGTPNLPFSTRNPVNPASLREYFRENSNGRFWFDRLGVIGPLNLGPYVNDPGPSGRYASILARVATLYPRLFYNIDRNNDNTVGLEELSVVVFENITGLKPANRINNPISIQLPASPVGGAQGSLSVHVAGAGVQTPFYQIAHELSHSLGTVDMYNTGKGNYGLTLMSGYDFFRDDQIPVHLDVWHKFTLGWAEPRLNNLNHPGSALIKEGADGAILLWDEGRQAAEYFLVERRRHASPSLRYDSGFPDDGALVWRVRNGVPDGVGHLGAPNLELGDSGVWKGGTLTPTISWSNGKSSGITLGFALLPDGSMRVAWGTPPLLAAGGRHRILFHGGNGTTLVDSGLPLNGVFYGITTSGHLNWYRYDGFGQKIGEPCDNTVWNEKSGNPIGHGWDGFRDVWGCGDGVILAVAQDGRLQWYQYNGDGEANLAGDRGWDKNSGNVIGRDWQKFRRVFVSPRAGRASNRLAIFAVDDRGDLHWYSYQGDGTADPTGTLGWHGNSGNVIGTGWGQFTHVFGAGGVIFAVDPTGALRWYSYSGNGEKDASGTKGWLPNSGNVIGGGWNEMVDVFGGLTDTGGFAYIIFGVTSTGDLRWYRYTGRGERDPGATHGWHPKSGGVIGGHW